MPHFVVHEHHANDLHGDFRLEFAGVLKPSVIPEGSAMDPSDKRLAIREKDHSLL
jgi:bifunctional non-homologous end joining protein LigD